MAASVGSKNHETTLSSYPPTTSLERISGYISSLASKVSSFFYGHMEDQISEEACEVIETTRFYHIPTEKAAHLASLIQPAGEAAMLAYELKSCVRSLELEGEEYEVTFFERRSGLHIIGTPVLFLESETKVVIAVPGTVDPNDWLSNLNPSMVALRDVNIFEADSIKELTEANVELHEGFLNVALSVFKPLKEKISQINPSKEILFTGHSQGAAVAQVLSLLIALTIKDRNPLAITFASPRVFSQSSYEFVSKKVPMTLTISHPGDGVPRFPLGYQGYRHVGIKLILDITSLAKVIRTETEDDMESSRHGDLRAASKVVSIAKGCLSPLSVLNLPIHLHGIDYYNKMCNTFTKEEFATLITGYHIEYETAPGKLTAKPSEPPSLRYVPGADEDSGSLFIYDKSKGNYLPF